MLIQVNWIGYYTHKGTISEVAGSVEVEVKSPIEALNAARGTIVEKLAIGSTYGLKQINLHRVEEGPMTISMNAFNDFIQTFNAEGGTDTVKRSRPNSFKISFSPDGSANITSETKKTEGD